MPEYRDDVKKALQKIEEKFGIVPHNGTFIYKVSGKPVKKSDDRERMNLIFDSMADCTLSDVERMIQSSAAESQVSHPIEIKNVQLIPLVDQRLAYLELNDLDRDLLKNLRIPFALDRETRALTQEKGQIVYLEGTKATRVASENLRLSVPESILKDIDQKVAIYKAEARSALFTILTECTATGTEEGKASAHEQFTTWLLSHVPLSMIPRSGGLKISAYKADKVNIPIDLIGWDDPLESLETKRALAQSKDLAIVNLPAISNDPQEIAVHHIDLTSLPDGETPAWDEMAEKFTEDEWDVLKAYIWATMDQKNFSRQSLVLYDNGHSGKSTLFSVLAWALGGEQNCAYPDCLQSTKDNRFLLSAVYGKHAVFVPDCKNPNFLRTGWIHNLTGRDIINVEFKQRNSFAARCYCKCFVATNTIPTLDIEADHIRSRLIILCPKLTASALEKLGQRDDQGNFRRDSSGKVLLKGDPLFEQHLKDEFWAFLRKCKDSYERLCPSGCTIELPLSVLENNEIAEDIVTTRILELCDDLFTFDLDSAGNARKCPCKDFYKAIDEALELHTIRGVDCAKVINILSENRGVVKKKVRVGEKTVQGFVGLALRNSAELDDLFDPKTPLDSMRQCLCDLDTSEL